LDFRAESLDVVDDAGQDFAESMLTASHRRLIEHMRHGTTENWDSVRKRVTSER
jgi:hypothetical protein